MNDQPTTSIRLFSCYFLLLISLVGCGATSETVTPMATLAVLANIPTPLITPFTTQNVPPVPTATEIVLPTVPPTPFPTYIGTPTADPPRATPNQLGRTYREHTVQFAESLGYIASLYGSTVAELMEINGLTEADMLYAGQILQVPGGLDVVGPNFKLIPDSELVYGPALKGFDGRATATAYNGYLLRYAEEVEGSLLSGPEIVQLVADRFQVSPRLLLAVLEYRAGWLTQTEVISSTTPLGVTKAGYEGLYQQLGWAANKLNGGFYGLLEGGVNGLTVADGTRVGFAADVNAGTAGVQTLLAAFDGMSYNQWLIEVSANGFYATYNRLFGNPFAYSVDPLWEQPLVQPTLQTPWTEGEIWYFTGGPHGGWASGSAWAALDFVPAGEQLGCYESAAWVRAMANGVVARSGMGSVVIDLDGDGFTGTGWVVHYTHLATQDRVSAGTKLTPGDPIGHPSCEGGYSNGTHVHIARTYNGRWVSADGDTPFAMGQWVSQGLGREYDGLLVNGSEIREACECREELNAMDPP